MNRRTFLKSVIAAVATPCISSLPLCEAGIVAAPGISEALMLGAQAAVRSWPAMLFEYTLENMALSSFMEPIQIVKLNG